MSAPLPDKCCGRCKHYREVSGYNRQLFRCEWPKPPLPFWASIDSGDHGEYTDLTQGTRCRCFEPKDSHE